MSPSRVDLLNSSPERFQAVFGGTPTVNSLAPGRVNLIGEHTDYNDGYVLPVAINRSLVVSARPRNDRQLVIHSRAYNETIRASLGDIQRNPHQHWSSYILGVAQMIQQHGVALKGADLLVLGDIPEGAGLSSSAALEVATAYALQSLNDSTLTHVEIAKLCQLAEQEFAGVLCGIMDQFACTFARENYALLIDCRTLEYNHVPFPTGMTLIVCYTGVKRKLGHSEYNRRQMESLQALNELSPHVPGLHSLRDLTNDDFLKHQNRLSPLLQKRCRHVISENGRVLDAVEALNSRNLSHLGSLMYESHMSLKNDYDVSSPELDTIVDICAESKGVYGARMTGAGFGGSAICLVENEYVDGLVERLQKEYLEKTGMTPAIFVCTVEGGVVVTKYGEVLEESRS